MDTPDNRGEVGPSVQSAKESLESKRDLLHAGKKVHTSCISVVLTLTNHINAGSKAAGIVKRDDRFKTAHYRKGPKAPVIAASVSGSAPSLAPAPTRPDSSPASPSPQPLPAQHTPRAPQALSSAPPGASSPSQRLRAPADR